MPPDPVLGEIARRESQQEPRIIPRRHFSLFISKGRFSIGDLLSFSSGITMQMASKASIFILLLQLMSCSSHELILTDHKQSLSSYESFKDNTDHKLNQQKISDMKLHGILLWVSMGFLMPVGILSIRISNKEKSPIRIKVAFYVHVIFQVIAVLLATAGAALSINSFENSFNNNHQRIGLALYGVIWIQVLIGFCRPRRGRKARSKWYFAHWILGTTTSAMGIINIYTGLNAYHKRTSTSVNLWWLFFTLEIGFLALIYLMQDKWEYMKKQGEVSSEPAAIITAAYSNQVTPQGSKILELLREPCRKSNALINYFKKSEC